MNVEERMMKNQLIKVCGMRDAQNIREVAALGVNLIGLIFYPKSPRYVKSPNSLNSLTPLPLSQGEGSNMLDKQYKTVGVFVNDMPQNIVTAVYNYHLSYVQLHGDESPVMIDNLRRTLVPDIVPQIKIIKAISISNAEDLKRCEQYEGHVDLFLFDTKCKGYGGSGQQYDWSVLEAYTGQTPFLLSGGIGPEDAERIHDFHHPRCIGIDLNSKFETAPGMKDVEMLKKFINSLTPLPLSKGEGSNMIDKQQTELKETQK